MLAPVDRWVELALDAGLAGLLLSIVATIAMILTRQPGRRLAIARWSLVGLLCIPPLTTLHVVPSLSLRATLRALVPPEVPGPSTGREQAPRDRSRPASVFRAVSWPTAALGVYAAGLTWGLASFLAGLAGAQWLRKLSEEAEPEVRALADELARLAGIRPPEIRFSRRVSRPVLFGLRNPCIILPHDFDRDPSSPALRLAILHECGHLRSCDPCFSALAHLTRIVGFVLPTVWWMCAQMRLDQEFQADRFAAEVFGPEFSYAKSLVALAEPGGVSREGGGGRALLPRVLMLVRCPFRIEPRPPLWWRLAIVPVIALMTVLATSLTWSDAAPPNPSSPGAKPIRHRFQLASLETADVGDADYVAVLPVVLSRHFDLALDVWASPKVVPRYRFAGYALSIDETDEVDDWHRVRIASTETGISAWFDGQPVSCRRESGSGDRPRLRLRSPGSRIGRYRNLVVSW
jgi:beta-lactamase regulating signal transducer with metallopeptidase domain